MQGFHSTCRHALLVLLLLGSVLSAAARGGRTVYDLNAGWAFHRGEAAGAGSADYDDSRWTAASLPHVMQLEKKHCGGDIIYAGVGWYRRYFRLPESAAGKRAVLSFEGVMNRCEVYVNGRRLAEHRGGYMGFTVDVTEALRRDGADNVLAVRVSAEPDGLTPPGKPQGQMDFYYYSGIYRDVRLVVTDKLHVTDELEEDVTAGGGVFVTFPAVSRDKATVRVRTHLRNGHSDGREGRFATLLRSPSGKVVARGEAAFTLGAGQDTSLVQSFAVDNPRLWHPYHPDLYELETRVYAGGRLVDSRTERIGIRTISYTTDGGFFINGEHLYLVGANRHQAFPHVGDAASNSMQERDVIAMKRGGYNAVRAAHYPHDPAFLDACDKYGLLVVECVPGWQYFNSDPVFTDRLEQVTRQMVRRDRNHPAVVLWETALNETHYPLEVVARINRAAHEEYPGNQFYTSGDYFGHEDTEPYYDVFYKQVGRFPADGNVMSNSLADQVAVKPLLTREWGDGAGPKPRVSLRENEYEQLRQCLSRLGQLDGNGYFDWCMLDANPRMGGHFMWSYNDYARGAEEETMYSGVVDMNRYPKFSYYMMQSMRPKDVAQEGLYEGPMVRLATFNDTAALPSSVSAVTVFSNCDAVRLYRNGRLVGEQTRAQAARHYPHIVEKGGSPCFQFDAGTYEAGELRAEGLVDGKAVAEHTVRTPGAPHHVEVCIADEGVQPLADGSDMIPVYFKVCDAAGTVVHSSDAEIRIRVEGEGRLVGDSIVRIGVNPQRVEGGVGFAFVRTTCRRGKIRVEASAEGLLPGSSTVRTRLSPVATLPGGEGRTFAGREEDCAVVRDSRHDREILSRPVAKVAEVRGDAGAPGYGLANAVDGDDFSWWIAGSEAVPQTVTCILPEVTDIYACRVRFQKDSSSYLHRVETSEDGQTWTPLYEKECTGWDFRPVRVERRLKYLRVVIEGVSEGRAGLAEVTLYR